jgi:glycosyltransferase involved in cell wall biosynthesis
MPRILHLLSSLEIGGKERAALRLARRAIADGFVAELFLFDSPYRSYDLDLDPAGVPWLFSRRGRGLDFRFIKTLAAHCAEKRIDVLHAHNDTAHVYAALAVRLMASRGPRMVTTLHTKPHYGGVVARFLTKNAAKHCGGVYAVSEQLAREVVATGWLKSCGVILNGVDTNEFSPVGPSMNLRSQLRIPEGHSILAHVARFAAIKKHEDLITALGLLRDQDCPVTVVCVGQGPRLSHIKECADSLSNIRFIEAIHDMPPFLRSVDGVILCSEHEATPLTLLEGMACGRPVIATAVGGVPALLGEAGGIMVPAGQPVRLAEAIATLAGDISLREALSRRSLQRAQAFGFEEEWATYLKLYQGVA